MSGAVLRPAARRRPLADTARRAAAPFVFDCVCPQPPRCCAFPNRSVRHLVQACRHERRAAPPIACTNCIATAVTRQPFLFFSSSSQPSHYIPCPCPPSVVTCAHTPPREPPQNSPLRASARPHPSPPSALPAASHVLVFRFCPALAQCDTVKHPAAQAAAALRSSDGVSGNWRREPPGLAAASRRCTAPRGITGDRRCRGSRAVRRWGTANGAPPPKRTLASGAPAAHTRPARRISNTPCGCAGGGRCLRLQAPLKSGRLPERAAGAATARRRMCAPTSAQLLAGLLVSPPGLEGACRWHQDVQEVPD